MPYSHTIGTVLVIFMAAATGFPQEDAKTTLGKFVVDELSDKTTCQITLTISEGGAFLRTDRFPPVLEFRPLERVFIAPYKRTIFLLGSMKRFKVDKNPVVVGDCVNDVQQICTVQAPAELFSQLAAGSTLLVGLTDYGKVYEFDLEDYRKALSACKQEGRFQ